MLKVLMKDQHLIGNALGVVVPHGWSITVMSGLGFRV